MFCGFWFLNRCFQEPVSCRQREPARRAPSRDTKSNESGREGLTATNWIGWQGALLAQSASCVGKTVVLNTRAPLRGHSNDCCRQACVEKLRRCQLLRQLSTIVDHAAVPVIDGASGGECSTPTILRSEMGRGGACRCWHQTSQTTARRTRPMAPCAQTRNCQNARAGASNIPAAASCCIIKACVQERARRRRCAFRIAASPLRPARVHAETQTHLRRAAE